MARASRVEESRADIMKRVQEIKQEISALDDEQRALLVQHAAKNDELAKINKIIDALAAIESLDA